MKLATVDYESKPVIVADAGEGRLALLSGSDVFPANDAVAASSEMRQLISAWDVDLETAINESISADDLPYVPIDSVQWRSPIADPGKICGVAMNNSASNARKIAAPNHPAFFLKPASSMIGHGQPIIVRSYYGSVHPEPELAVIVGQRMRDLQPEQVAERIFGYTIMNDLTGNGMRAEDMFHYFALYPNVGDPDELEQVEQHLSYAARYKGTDSFCVIGPWITTADAVNDPDDLRVTCFVGDEKIADDSTRYYNYSIREVLSFLSYFQTLNPGDVISLGTAFRPGATRKSIHHANLQEVGGPVAIEIEQLGRQQNPVVVEDMELGRWRCE